jgi:hypothetical protein
MTITSQETSAKLELTLPDGITLVSLLLSMGYYRYAASLARQLLLQFPQTLQLHVGIGRALAVAGEREEIRRAVAHLNRVLDADPDNWRIRLEIALLFLHGGEGLEERAGEELWQAVQTAPDSLWLRSMLERLPDHPAFEPARSWMKAIEQNSAPPADLKSEEWDDTAGIARLYLRRNLPAMAARYFEKALAANLTPPMQLKTGLLLSFWQDKDEKRASALASEMLLAQPQLILPRLLLASYLGRGALAKSPQALGSLLGPVLENDPFLERTGEICQSFAFNLLPEAIAYADPTRRLLESKVAVRLDNFDPEWVSELLDAGKKLENPRAEVSFGLLQTDGVSFISGSRQKGKENSDIDPELEEIATKIADVENMLYGLKEPYAFRKKSGKGIMPKGTKGKVSRDRVPSVAPLYVPNLRQGNASYTRLSTVLLVSSERNLISKYGQAGYNQIKPLLQKLSQLMRQRGFDCRLLMVDSSSALEENGFYHLDPVRAGDSQLVGSLINAALAGESEMNALNVVFIIGGPDIVPFWRLGNPSIDSDREVLSDNPYGTRDSAYLLPERIVGRLPDSADGDLGFFLRRLRDTLERQRAELVAPKIAPSLPLRMLETILPNGARDRLDALDGALRFEQKWFRQATGERFLDRSQLALWSPFFYSAQAWQRSTETIRTFMGSDAPVTLTPPTNAGTLNLNMIRAARLLHFNLHGFKDNPNWYGQGEQGRLLPANPLSSLPLAFTPNLTNEIKIPGVVVFSEACYGGNLSGKDVDGSIALSMLDRGAQAVIGSTVISYGAAGPELACASHLAYYFWKGVLRQGYTYGQALQAAKSEYARARLSAGHDLSNDDAKTLMEFVLLGDPTVGLRPTSPDTVKPFQDPTWKGEPDHIQKGWFFPRLEEELNIRKMAKGLWERLVKPRERYRPVEYRQLPPDLLTRIEKILEWLLPDPMPDEPDFIQALLEMGRDYRRPARDTGRFMQKGGEDGELLSQEEQDGARLLLSGQRSLRTEDGHLYRQTFHLSTDFNGDEMSLNLSRGKG